MLFSRDIFMLKNLQKIDYFSTFSTGIPINFDRYRNRNFRNSSATKSSIHARYCFKNQYINCCLVAFQKASADAHFTKNAIWTRTFAVDFQLRNMEKCIVGGPKYLGPGPTRPVEKPFPQTRPDPTRWKIISSDPTRPDPLKNHFLGPGPTRPAKMRVGPGPPAPLFLFQNYNFKSKYAPRDQFYLAWD